MLSPFKPQLLGSAFLLSILDLSSSNPLITKDSSVSPLEVTTSVAWAIQYAYPLTAYAQTFFNTTANIGTNTINRGNATSTAAIPILVRPNPDYIYSPVATDLSHDNVEITVPEFADGRSWIFPFNDLYGNQYASLSSASKTPPGKYLLKLDDCVSPGLTMEDSDYSEYQGVITSATAWGSIMIRIVTYGNITDLAAALDVESKIEIEPITRVGPPTGPALTSKTLQPDDVLTAAAFKQAYQLNSSDVTTLLTLMAAIQEFNPPANQSDYEVVRSTLSAAGVSNGKYTPRTGFNLTISSKILEESISKALAIPTATSTNPNYIPAGNSWLNLVPALCGDFSDTNADNYVLRAFTAYSGYFQLVSDQAIYPEYVVSDGLSVSTNESYIMHFSGPPLTAFWSLALYVENYLVPNPLNRFSLHAESNITYAADGSYDILIQVADVAPSANWTSNWLPGPAGGGNISVNFRNYGPEAGMENGTYVYPVVTKVSAITG